MGGIMKTEILIIIAIFLAIIVFPIIIDEAIDKFREMDNFIWYQGVQELLINYHIDSVCPYCGHDLK